MSNETQQSIAEREKQYLLQNYGRYPLALLRGKGSWVYGYDGKRYLDLITGIGVNALGHGHPRLVKAIRDQAGKMIHCSNLYYHEYQGKLAERICKMSGLQRVFFANSGTEAVEGAIKMMRAHGHRVSPDKYEIIALDNSFHGRSTGAIALTGQPKYRKDFEPLIPGVRFVPANDVAALEAAFSHRTCGVIIEVIQGEGGVCPVSLPMLKKARELADRFNALLVFDEIQCGVGRSGKYFAYQALDELVMPDVIVTAKPLAVGIPLGVIACNERAAVTLGPGLHGSTFGGGLLATRAAIEFLDVLDDLLPNVIARGEQFRAGLEGLRAKHGYIKEVRVFGLMIGVDLRMPGKQFVTDAMDAGMLINCTHDTVLRFLPPFTISEKEVAVALKTLGKMFAKGEAYWAEHQQQVAKAAA